ncbi:MAG TPA: hypothetical protein VG868_05285 [Casimicrobiaceae bacterium]|jgi:hypothetical protein|nr:hypothetical protein [Casimicrobiaceae bacterium]
MEQDPRFDEPEFGASTGDVRENDPSLPGFTENDPLFRSHFQHANRLADREYEDARPAYRLGFGAAGEARYAGKSFDEAEKDLENDWLNVRVAGDEWQSVRDYAREGYERGRKIGFVSGASMLGGSASHQRPSFSDPLPAGTDPTAPDSPENA